MLRVVSVEKAKEIINEKFCYKAEAELINIDEAVGRILYDDVVSSEDVPSFNRSTVDGFAVRSADVFGCSETMAAQLNIIGETAMGENSSLAVGEGECVRIPTGGMLPEGADAVVMVENTDESFSPLCLIFKAASPFENVTKRADDIKSGTLVCEKGKVITGRDIGIFACLGISKISAVRRLKIGIISTGDEIIPIEEKAVPGKIRDVNSHILSSFAKETGCVPKMYGIIRDNRDEITDALKKAAEENDIVFISGGSSAGEKDLTADIISELGEVYLHGIAMKPGKPTIVGKINNKAVFGLPGHPAAAYFVALTLVRPLIESVCGISAENAVEAVIDTNISSNHGREELVCVRLCGEKAIPVLFKSGIISLLSSSDGYIRIDRNAEGLKKGDTVKVYLF